jgi:alpha-galactosidase
MKLMPSPGRGLAALLLLNAALHAAPIPLSLPDPDGKPGDPSKPVKVYILAGQSNMVGMGDISGAAPEYPGIYLSADPAIIPGRMPIGSSRSRGACTWGWKNVPGLMAHGVYQSADAGSPAGARVSLFQGAYDKKADYAKLKPAKSTTMPLGTAAATIPTLEGPSTAVADAFIDVPASGNYLVHVGLGASTHATATLDGTEVYRKEPSGQAVLNKVALEAGKRYPLQITWFQGGSAALWLEQVDLVGKGDLVTLTKKDGKFPYLLDEAGNWTVRNDVYFQEARLTEGGKGAPMSAESNKKCLPKCNSIGPEVGFGFVMGEFHDEQVLLIKTAQGNRSLQYDFRPPSSGKTSNSEYEGYEYRAMLKGVRDTLANIDKVVPGYQGQGYEIAGFAWFQGHKDSGSTKEDYEQCLVNLIKDLRKDLDAPKMKAVVASVGFEGYRLMTGPWKGVWEAQMAVGDAKQHPDFAGSVASVDTRDFWRELEESPRNQNYHYHRNPEFYLLTGEAMGRAMVRLLGGQSEEIPKSDREAKTMAAMAAEAATPAPTAAAIEASDAACKPMIIDGLLARFLADPRTQAVLKSQLVPAQPTPAKPPESLDDAVDDAVAILQAAGISEYDWTPVIADMRNGSWEYTGFNLADSPYNNKPAVAPASDENEGGEENTADAPKPTKDKGGKPATNFSVTYPAGLEQWFAPDFDTKKAGWKSAPAPFGVKRDEMVPENLAWLAKYEIYPLKRALPATVIDHDVVLMRKTLELPPLQEGHRYRIVVDGSIHENSGEGYAIYVNGKLLAEVKNGVTSWRRQGMRGSHVWQDFLDDFKGGKITIAVANFPMANYDPDGFIPTLRPLSVWIESQKLPELGF